MPESVRISGRSPADQLTITISQQLWSIDSAPLPAPPVPVANVTLLHFGTCITRAFSSSELTSESELSGTRSPQRESFETLLSYCYVAR